MAHLIRKPRNISRRLRVPGKRRWDELLDRIPPDQPFTVVEVGVWQGATATRLLAARPLLHMILVDAWSAATPESSWMRSGSKMAREPQSQVEFNFDTVKRMTAPYQDRVTILRDYSVPAAAQVPDASVDLVFIDADHSYEGVRADIAAWLPKIKRGGFISGHDYKSPRFPGVAQAVYEAFGVARVIAGANSTWFVQP